MRINDCPKVNIEISSVCLSVTTIRAHFNFRTTQHDFKKSVECRVPPPSSLPFGFTTGAALRRTEASPDSRLQLEGWLSFIDRTR